MNVDFTGRVGLVTGATAGIGRAMADALAAAGARVFVNSEDPVACERVLGELGKEAVSLAADLSDPLAIADLARRAWAVTGRIDHLFCNAGIVGCLRIGDPGYEDEVARVFAINLHHARWLCDRLVPQMVAAGRAAWC